MPPKTKRPQPPCTPASPYRGVTCRCVQARNKTNVGSPESASYLLMMQLRLSCLALFPRRSVLKWHTDHSSEECQKKYEENKNRLVHDPVGETVGDNSPPSQKTLRPSHRVSLVASVRTLLDKVHAPVGEKVGGSLPPRRNLRLLRALWGINTTTA